MIIKSNLTIHKWNDNKWVVQYSNTRNFLLNNFGYKLILVLQNNDTLEDAHKEFNQVFSSNKSLFEFHEIVEKFLGGYDILINDTDIKRPNMKNQYLNLKIQILNSKMAGWMARPLAPLFSPNLFWKIFIFLALFLFVLHLNVNISVTSLAKIDKRNLPLAVFLIYLRMLVHELGHIAACKNAGVKHGGVGVGFYIIMPVVYADITNIWLANKEQRIIANLGGIFGEMLYLATLSLIYITTHVEMFYFVVLYLSVFTLWELNPFVRFDGYWLLSEITNTPNLLFKSKSLLNKSIKNVLSGNYLNLGTKDQLLLLYGIINMLFVFGFMGFIFFSCMKEIFMFPKTIYSIILCILEGKSFASFISQTFFAVLTFYILFARFLLFKIAKNISNIGFMGSPKFGEIKAPLKS